jgi:signal transduction histidine kinase
VEILYDEGVRFPRGVVPARQGLSGWVLQNRKPLRSNDLTVDLQRLGIAPNHGGRPDPSRSWLGVPMMRGDLVLGVLAVASYETNAFSRDDEELLSNVAAQAAIAIENARLYQEARNRLGELQKAQEQMISMSRLATSAELAAGLGHEINNALTPILGVTQLSMRRADLSDDLQDDLGRVLSSAQRIRHIVKTFSEMATGRTLANQRRNINTIVLSALELFEWQFSSHHISVDLRLTESLPDIACDVLQLRQAVANVLLNSLDAMPQGGTITISTFLEDDNVCARITDTGSGIDQGDLERVFDPWFTTKVEDGRARGLGLGLFATYNVVKAHGGLVELASEIGQGTSVLICLPIDQ